MDEDRDQNESPGSGQFCPPPLSDVWTGETDTLIQAIESGLNGVPRHIAIISGYLAGRESLISKVACVYPGRVARIVLDSFSSDSSRLDLPEGADIILLENCQYLFRRKIHGFSQARDLIRVLTWTDKLWITSWNIHSWRYLDAVLGIGRLFPVQISLGQLDAPRLREYILAEHTSPIFYVIDAPLPKRLLFIPETAGFTLPGFGRDIRIPYYRLNRTLLGTYLQRKKYYADPDEIIFDRLTLVSDGNPGIALRIWEESLDAWEIRMSNITPSSLPKIPDPASSYLLFLVLALENPSIGDLSSVIPDDIPLQPILYQLTSWGFLEHDNGRVSIRPIAVAGVTAEMKRLRMVW